MNADCEPPNVFFRLVIAVAAAFILTIFAMVATLFGDQNTPLSHFFDKHGELLIAGEVVGILFLGFMAMRVDSRRTLRRMQDEAEQKLLSSEDVSPSIEPLDASRNCDEPTYREQWEGEAPAEPSEL